MHTLRKLFLLGLTSLFMFAMAADALAQQRGGAPRSGAYTPEIEIAATYGHMWGGNIEFRGGKLRTGTAPAWGFALDYGIHPYQAIEFSYTRQDGQFDWDPRGGAKYKLTDTSINYWQLGTLRYFPVEGFRPFVLASLGLTYYSPSGSTINIDGTDYAIESSTKFSFNLGLGFKKYFGQNEKIGVRASFKVMPTLYDSGAGLWFGTGGASLGITGYAIWQFEAAAGLTVKFGS
jgi:hypothetical protein